MSSKNRPFILITEPEYFTPQSIKIMQRVGEVKAERLSRGSLIKIIPRVNILVVRVETTVNVSLLKLASNLQCIVSATTGTNHIDVKYLASRNIPFFHLSGIHSVPTAEHTIALLISAARRIPFAHQSMETGVWKRWEYIGTEIDGKILGIVGVGRIGSEVAKRAKGLGLEVIGYDPYLSESEIKLKHAKKVNFETFLRKSDFISIHTPLTEETHNMISFKHFKKMKPSAILVNTARGAIINTKALLQALVQNKINSAALDVYNEEPLSKNSSLIQYAKNNTNLILTPHIAASTKEAIERASLYTANTVTKFLRQNHT
ncbi:MAG: hydroxyacid dehydrogenase [Patescibacteria group bacterium]